MLKNLSFNLWLCKPNLCRIKLRCWWSAKFIEKTCCVWKNISGSRTIQRNLNDRWRCFSKLIVFLEAISRMFTILMWIVQLHELLTTYVYNLCSCVYMLTIGCKCNDCFRVMKIIAPLLEESTQNVFLKIKFLSQRN